MSKIKWFKLVLEMVKAIVAILLGYFGGNALM